MSFFSYPKPTSWYGDTVIRRQDSGIMPFIMAQIAHFIK